MIIRKFAVHWVLLVLTFSVVGGVLAWEVYKDFLEVEGEQTARLQSRVQIIEQNLNRQLLATDRSLAVLREDLPVFRSQPDPILLINRRLRATGEAIPGVRSVLIINADGDVYASSRPELIGMNFHNSERYQLISTDPAPTKLFISPPFVTPLGVYAISFGKAVLDDQNQFAGYILAIADPEFFRTLLHSTIRDGDMQVAVIHAGGKLIYRVPDPQKLAGQDIALPDSPLDHHLRSGQRQTVYSGLSNVTGEKRLIVTHTVETPNVHTSHPLVIAISRERSAMLAKWRSELYLRASLFALLLSVGVGGLLFYHNRQRVFDAVAAQEELKRRQAEASLRQNEEHLATTLRSIADAVVVTDAAGRIMQMNATAERLTGWTVMEARQHTLQEVVQLVNADTREAITNPAQLVMQRGEAVGLANHTTLIAKDGSEYQIADSAAPIRDARNQITGVVLVFSDVTEQYRINKALRENEALLKTLTDHAQVGMVMISQEHRYVYVNAAYTKVLGRRPDDMIGKHVGEVWPALYESTIKPRIERAFQGQGGSYDLTLPPSPGKDMERHYSVIFEPPVETRFGPCTIVLLMDITERRRAEAQRIRLAAAVESSSDAIFIRDLDFRIVYWNKGAEQMFGFEASEVLGKIDGYRVTPEQAKARQEIWEKLKRGETVEPFHGVRGRKDGLPIDISVAPSAVRDSDGKIVGIVTIARDITERIRAMAALRESQAKLRAALEAMNDAVIICDTQGRFVEFNEAFTTFHRYNHKDECPKSLAAYHSVIEARSVADEILPPDRWLIPRALCGENGAGAELVLRRMDTGVTWIGSFTYAPIRNETGEIVGAVVTGRDVTENKRAEEVRARLAAIIEQSQDAVLSRSLDGTILTWNAGAERLFGYTAQEVLGHHIAGVLPTDSPSNVIANNAAVARGEAFSRESSRYTRDGRKITVRGSYSPLRDESGKVVGVSLIMHDITALKAAEAARATLEAQLREAQKMEAIGTLAGGIAHDFNNIIASIMGNADLARQDARDNAEVLESITEITKAARRARDLVQQILSFSRRQPTELKQQPLDLIVRETARLLRATLPKRISLDVQCQADTPLVMADSTQVQQALINLANNAAQAIPEGAGRIGILLDSVVLNESLAAQHPELGKLIVDHPGPAVRIRVTDTGSGMSSTTLQRIFEPFFTTKPTGEGTGLGLPVVHGIVRGHDGAILVDSELDRGTTFSIYLPAAATPEDNSAADPRSITGRLRTAGDGLRVLYIDDDAMLATMVARVMERRGFHVAAYTNQKEALELLQSAPEAFDVVLTDYNMPDLSGLDVARAVRDIRPTLPVIVTSGFIDDTLLAKAKDAGAWELVSKTDSPEELCFVLYRIIQSQQKVALGPI